MTVIRDISEIDSFVPTVEQAEKALEQFIHGKHGLHVPPEFEDADIVIGAVIREWQRLKVKEDAE